MLAELTQGSFVLAVSAFLLGVVVASGVAHLIARRKAAMRDPRDIRIRSLEAECRVSRADAETMKEEAARLETELKDLEPGLERRDKLISEQQAKIEQLRLDLTSSVKKTRQLRAELAERATENVHAEAKIREVETELSIVQASTDLISTGVLDYDSYDESEDDDKTAVLGESVTAKAPG